MTREKPEVRRSDPTVEGYLRDLQSDRATAERTYRALWEVPREFIPYLIEHVDSPARSPLKELALLVLDEKQFADYDEENKVVRAYRIPGLGAVDYDDLAAGKAKRGGYKVVIRNRRGFTVGVVLRAALNNRFRSPNGPRHDATDDPVGWWQAFYRRMRSKL